MSGWKRWCAWMTAGTISIAAALAAAGQEADLPADPVGRENGEAEPQVAGMSPKEELKAIWEHQEYPGSAAATALKETLGISQIKEKIREKGLDASIKLSFTVDTLMEATIAGSQESDYLEVQLQYSPLQKRWLLDGGVTLLENDIISGTLYADEEMLTLSVPQIYQGAVGIRAGSLMEQYRGSGLSVMLGELPAMEDAQLSFVPGEEGTAAEIAEAYENWAEEFREAMENMADDIQVEKISEGERDIYTVSFLTEDLEDFYLDMVDAYLDGLERVGALPGYETAEVRSELFSAEALRMFDGFEDEFMKGQIEAVDGEIRKIELEVDFRQEEGDGSGYGSLYDSETGEPEQDAGMTSGSPIGQTEPAILKLCADLERTSLDMKVTMEENEKETDLYKVQVRSASGERSAMDTIEVWIWYGEEEPLAPLYKVESYFDRETGNYQEAFSLGNMYGGQYSLQADCSFTQIISGESFLCTVDSARIQSEYDDLGAKLEIRVDTSGTQVEKPENIRMIMEMSPAELTEWMMESGSNLEKLGILGGSSSNAQEYEESGNFASGGF